jgi:uncharacterized protein YprB with RNaseH-like and TPR domain
VRDLKSRLREIVRQDTRPAPPVPIVPQGYRRDLTYVPDPDPSDPAPHLARALGGEALAGNGACVVIDRTYASDRSHGRKRIEACVPAADEPLHLFDDRLESHSNWADRVVFFDIETTGLSGGAGTIAFLAGCGWFEEGGFKVRQFFLAGPSGEHAQLAAIREVFERASLLVTFNGRTFDVPFMDTRWAFHRAASPADGLPHFDMLPPARRLWGMRTTEDAGSPRASGTSGVLSCSLTALERTVLGVHRHDDVPGFEIPARYFHFVRTGDAAAIDGVLEHNRADIVSLAVLMSHALWLAREGPDACREPGEQLALGRIYERAGDHSRARVAFERAIESGDGLVKRRALACLALQLRRESRHDEAATAWQQVLDMAPETGGLSLLERRAVEALAIHHEHRRKDPSTARRYAEALGRQASGSLRREVDHRLHRLDRKLSGATGSAPLFSPQDGRPIDR